MAIDGAVVLPLMSVSGDEGITASITLPMISLNVDGAQITLPLFSTSAEIRDTHGDVVLPLFAATGTGEVGAVGSASIAIPMFDVAGRAGRSGYAEVELPLFEIAATAGVTAVITGAVSLPMPYFLGAVYNPPTANTPDTAVSGGTYQVWTVNPINKRHTQYDNFLFNSFGEFNGSNYACGSDGIYKLTGDEDVSAAIDISLIWAMSNMGSSRVKWVDAAYVHLRGDTGALEVWAKVDERTERVYTIDLSQSPEGLHVRRSLFERGLFGTWWSVGVKASCTTPISVSDIELRVVNRQRRLR